MGLLCFLSLIELIKLMLTSSPNYQLLCCAMRYAPCPAIISYESAWLNSSDFPTLSPSQLLNFLTSIFSHFLLFCSSALLIFLTSYPLTHRLTLSPTFRYELSASSPSGFQASQLFFAINYELGIFDALTFPISQLPHFYPLKPPSLQASKPSSFLTQSTFTPLNIPQESEKRI